MGSRSSPGIFDNLPVVIEWICQVNYDVNHICHFLDDFLGAESGTEKGKFLEIILKLFEKLGVPVAPNKVHGPTTWLEFLGITLDTVLLEARLSTEKVSKLREIISLFLSKNKCSKRELLSLIGS